MRQKFIQIESKKKAENEALWASKIVKVVGGFMAFESIDDFKVWKNQN